MLGMHFQEGGGGEGRERDWGLLYTERGKDGGVILRGRRGREGLH